MLRTQFFRLSRILCLLSTTTLLLPARAEPGSSELDHRGAPVVFQVSTLDALSFGLYQGVYAVGALKRRGDFGLGTFEGIDGEMTILNGHFYHFRSDGVVTEEPDCSRVPFAVITTFRSDTRFSTNGVSMDELGRQIDQHIPSTNLFYAIRIHGTFSELTTRAIPKLFPPYPPLSKAVEKQVEFPFQNIKGTLVAFRCPDWVKGINQVGYHYHFISDDESVGGHALSFTTGPVTVEIQELQQNSIWVPDKGPFLTAPLPVTQ
jgi:acetolactate decarboxylase